MGLKFNLLSYDRIEVSTQDWQASQVKITRSDDGKKLFTSCSCNERDMCEHRLFVFDYIGERFGILFFAKDYENNLISNYVQERKLQSVEEFHRFYAVQLTPEGPKLESKYQNLIAIDDFSEIFKEEIKGDEYPEIPFQNIENQEEGIGFCIGYYKGDFSQFFPISAKFNKDKTDFSSKIKRIFDYDSSLYQDKSFTDEQILAISKVNKGMNLIDTRKNRDFKLGVQILSEILTHQPPFFIYSKDERDSFARKNLEKLTIVKEPIRLFFELKEAEEVYQLIPRIELGEKKHLLKTKKIRVAPFFVQYEENLYPVSNPRLSSDLQRFKDVETFHFFKDDVQNLFEKVIKPLSRYYEVISKILKKSPKKIEENQLEKHLYISETAEDFVVLKPFVKYGETLIPLYSKELLTADMSTANLVEYIARNEAYEDEFLEEIRNLHTDFQQQGNIFYLQPEQLLENYWLLHSVEKLKSSGVQVFGANNLKSFRFNINKPNISVNLESGIDWFDIKIDIQFGNQKVSLKDLQQSFIKKSNYVALGDGTLGVLPEDWMKKFAVYFKAGEVKKNAIQLSNYQFGN